MQRVRRVAIKGDTKRGRINERIVKNRERRTQANRIQMRKQKLLEHKLD